MENRKEKSEKCIILYHNFEQWEHDAISMQTPDHEPVYRINDDNELILQ
jgi:hypothetical protein